MLREFVTRPHALPRPEHEALRNALLASPLVGRSTLAGPFLSSRGFAVTFRGAGRARVEERFPSIGPWLDAVLGAPTVKAMMPWWQRALGRTAQRVPNAWYLNVLLVSPGGSVARHLDTTLCKPAGVETSAPEMVSVLYLAVPQATGGALQLWSGPTPLATVQPRDGMAVHFRGDLAHAVLPFDGPPEALRASLVIEQYCFDDEALSRLPEFQLDSRAGFKAFLKIHEGREAKFELE